MEALRSRLMLASKARPVQPAASAVPRTRPAHAVSDALPAHSAQSAPGSLPFFFQGAGLPLHHDEGGVGEQGQRHIAVPGAPRAHFILVEPYFSLGLFIALLNLPPAAGHAYHLRQRRPGGTGLPGSRLAWSGSARLRRIKRKSVHALADRLCLIWQLQPRPFVQPGSFAALTSRQGPPKLSAGKQRGEQPDRLLSSCTQTVCVSGDRQHVVLLLLVKPRSATHRNHRQCHRLPNQLEHLRKGSRQHTLGEFAFGGKLHLIWNACFPAAYAIARPLLR